MRLSELQGETKPELEQPASSGILGEGFLGEIPQTAGSLLSLAKSTTPMGMALSGIGGAGGEAFKQIGQHVVGSELAPTSPQEAAGRIGRAFLEEAAFEGGGRMIGAGLTKVAGKFRPKLKEDFDAYEESFKQHGGRLSATQQIEHSNLASWSLLTLDGLSRGSITAKGIYKNFDDANDAALRSMADQLIEDISTKATSTLTDHQVGRLFIDSVEKGKAAHSVASGKNYSAVDEIAKENGVVVNTGKLKTMAAQWKNKFNKIGNVGRGEIASTEIDNILKVPKEIGFEDAHFLRSALLNKQRELELKGETGVSKKILADMIDSVNKIMDDAGNTSGIQDAYKKAAKFHKFGAETFNDRFMVKLMQKDPERIGETIFRAGNVSLVIESRQALKKASIFDKSIDFDDTWKAVQEGYMSSLLSGPLVDEAGTPVGKRISKLFEDKKRFRTLKSAFSSQQLSDLKQFAKIAETVQAKPEAGLSMVMQLTQGGAIVAAVSGVLEESVYPVFLGPPVVAKLLTNPDKAKLLLKGLTSPMTPKGAAIVTKLIGDMSLAEKQAIDRDTEANFQQ